MRVVLPKIISMLEIVIGILLVGIGTYSLVEAMRCRPEATYCESMTMLSAVLTLIPGGIVLAAGVMTRSTRIRSVLRTQLLMIGALTLYFLVCYLFFFHIAPRLQ